MPTALSGPLKGCDNSSPHSSSKCRSCRRVRPANYRKQGKGIYKGTNKEKSRAILGQAVRRGKIKREPCDICGSTPVVAHHDDYGKPLQVRWLCKAHNRMMTNIESRWGWSPQAGTRYPVVRRAMQLKAGEIPA